MEYIIAIIITTVVTILIGRAFGSWMLRINEVIDLQKEMLKEMKKLNRINGSKNEIEEDEEYKEPIEDGKIIKVKLTDDEITNKTLGITYSKRLGDIVIDEVMKGTSCYKYGLKIGDIIVSLNGIMINEINDLTKEINKRKKMNYPTYTFRIK